MRQVNSRPIIAVILMLAIAIGGFGCSKKRPEGSGSYAGAGRVVAPDFALQDLNGETVNLSKLRGQPVMITFWTTWCEVCKEEMPQLERLYQEYKTKIQVLAINVQESRDSVERFISENKLTFKVLLDSQGTVSRKYMIRGVPTNIFLDKEGKLVYVIPGGLNYEQMKKYIQELI